MIISKFGGSSIKDHNSILKVLEIIKEKLNNNNKVILVFSASGKTTDSLLETGKIASDKNKNNYEYKENIKEILKNHINIIDNLLESEYRFKLKEEIENFFKEIQDICLGIYYLKDFSNKISDKLLSYGEKISNLILYYYFSQEFKDKKIKLMDSTEYLITDNSFSSAKIIDSQTKSNFYDFNLHLSNDILIFPGFISKDENNNITTLGRGGGDYTAALIGSNLECELVEIWTDVNGIMTSDPRIVKNSRSIKNISYNEMMELSHYGANVIYTPTILPLYNKKIPLIVKNTFNPNHEGTRIDFERNSRDEIATAVSNIRKVTLIKIYGNYLIGNIGFSGSLFSLFSNYNINIIMISQSSSEHSIYIVINQKDFETVKYVLNKSYEKQIITREVIIDFWNNKSVLAIETNNSENIIEISSKIYPIFQKNKKRIYSQITSDHNICLVIDENDLNFIQILVHDEIFN